MSQQHHHSSDGGRGFLSCSAELTVDVICGGGRYKDTHTHTKGKTHAHAHSVSNNDSPNLARKGFLHTGVASTGMRTHSRAEEGKKEREGGEKERERERESEREREECREWGGGFRS